MDSTFEVTKPTLDLSLTEKIQERGQEGSSMKEVEIKMTTRIVAHDEKILERGVGRHCKQEGGKGIKHSQLPPKELPSQDDIPILGTKLMRAVKSRNGLNLDERYGEKAWEDHFEMPINNLEIFLKIKGVTHS